MNIVTGLWGMVLSLFLLSNTFSRDRADPVCLAARTERPSAWSGCANQPPLVLRHCWLPCGVRPPRNLPHIPHLQDVVIDSSSFGPCLPIFLLLPNSFCVSPKFFRSFFCISAPCRIEVSFLIPSTPSLPYLHLAPSVCLLATARGDRAWRHPSFTRRSSCFSHAHSLGTSPLSCIHYTKKCRYFCAVSMFQAYTRVSSKQNKTKTGSSSPVQSCCL